MGHPDGAHTHGGGGFDPMPLLIIIGTAAAVAVVGPVLVAVLHALIIAAAVIGGLALAGGAAYVALRVHRWRLGGTTRVSSPAPRLWRPVETRREPRQAIGHVGQLHLHFHGIDAEDVAEILAQHGGQVDHPEL